MAKEGEELVERKRKIEEHCSLLEKNFDIGIDGMSNSLICKYKTLSTLLFEWRRPSPGDMSDEEAYLDEQPWFFKLNAFSSSILTTITMMGPNK